MTLLRHSWKAVKRPLALAGLCFLVFFIIIPLKASADTGQTTPKDVLNSTFDCVSHPFTCAVYGITWIATLIITLLITLFAWIVRIALDFNSDVFNAAAVQVGYHVSLALANLGFVFAIIIIAIATILKRETYGIKKSLWRLVAMALLVNFGLVIAAPIVNFANQLTNVFIQASTPNNSGSYLDFVNTLTVTFAPNTLLVSPVEAVSSSQDDPATKCAKWAATLNSIKNSYPPLILLFHKECNDQQQLVTKAGPGFLTGDLEAFTQQVLNMIFVIIFGSIIALTFAALGILLFVRYVYLGILLIVLPLAWLTWIFPKVSENNSKWWKQFFRWTFFPPIVTFFLYLALLTSMQKQYLGKHIVPFGSDGKIAPSNKTQEFAVAQLTNNPGLLSLAGQEVMMVALALAGIFAANALSITGASTAMKAMQSVGNAAGKYAWNRTKQAGTAPFRSERARNWMARTQQPNRGFFTRWTGRLAMGAAAYGGEKAVQEVDVGKDTADQNRQKISTSRAPVRIKRLKRLIDDKKVGDLTEEELQQYAGKDKEAMYKRYGPEGEKIYKDLREKSGLALRDLQKEEEDLKVGRPADLDVKLKENKEKQDTLLKKMDSEDLAGQFQDAEKREEAKKKAEDSGKPIPASLSISPDSIRRMQEGIVRAMTEGFSPEKASGLIRELDKKNSLNLFEKAVQTMKKDPGTAKYLHDNLVQNKNLMRYIARSPSRNTIVDYQELFDVKDDELSPYEKKKGTS